MESVRSAVILAGGLGRRIGEEKAFLRFQGQSMIRRSVERLRATVDEVVVVGRDRAQSKRLSEAVPEARVAWDLCEGFGPVAGLAAGMQEARGEYAFCCGCDLPFLNAAAIDLLFDLAKGFDGSVPIWKGGQIERLHAVYRREGMAQACAHVVMNDLHRISSATDGLCINFVPVERLESIEGGAFSLVNINTKEDLELSLRIADGVGNAKQDGCGRIKHHAVRECKSTAPP
jgi:molybdopterin-guanine dinucleotide biosynthesis protein A